MLESLLLPHLNAALSAVFEDLETHQVEASILGGSLVLRNLKLKEDALAPLSLPIDVAYGHVGALTIKLNLLRLMTEPIVICAEDVLLVATTQHPSAWSIEREQNLRDQQRNLILLTDECLTYAREESGLPSVLQRAVYALIQKLRLSIKGLELRLEDTETSSTQAFAIGLRATQLYNVQCSANWDEERSQGAPDSSLSTAAISSSSRPIPRNVLTQSCQGWFEWITGFGRKQKDVTPSSEGIPESFYIKTVLQDACLYLDPLSPDGPHSPWLPYPASYRQQILSDVEELVQKKRFFLSNAEAGLPIPFGSPVDGGGPGCAKPTTVGKLLESLRRRQRMPGDHLNHQEAVEKPRGDHEDADSNRSRGIRTRRSEGQATSHVDARSGRALRGRVRSPSTSEELGVASEDQKHTPGGKQLLIRMSDLYVPEELLQLSAVTAKNHLYIVQPIDVEIRARCAQRPVVPPAGMKREFRRPFASSSSGSLKKNAPQPAWGSTDATTDAASPAAEDDDYLPPISVAVIFHSICLHVIPIQLTSLCRWLHFGTFLYQEFVSGVYAECLDLTPGDEEMELYKRAWERHLLAYAFAAAGGDSLLGQRAAGPLDDASFDPAVDAREDVDDLDDVSVNAIISSFENKYWPTVTILLRQQVLKNLQQRAHPRRDKSPDSGSLDASFLEQGFDRSATSRLATGVAGELSFTATADENHQVLKCIEKMKPQRFSKNVEFTVEFNGIGLTLSAAHGVENCIHVELAELAVHLTFYYDLRISVVVAFEGVQVRDDLLPNLAHRHVLTGEPPPKHHWLLQEAPGPRCAWDGTQGNLSAGSGLQKEQASIRSSSVRGTPPTSPFQSDGGNCILDWNSACFWHNAECPFRFYERGEPASREEKHTSHGAQAGGWLRFVKVFVPVEGVPDIVLHLQTHGSILCTITPAAVANLVQTLQEPVCLMERSYLLELASREVQEVFHRNELLMAKLLLGDLEHTTIDMCVDIPVPHQLLLPFDHKNPKCRGVLLQTGRIAVDTLLGDPRTQPSTACDRYLATASGTCVQRVFDCMTVKRFPRAPRNSCTFSTPRFSLAAGRTKEGDSAATPGASESSRPDVSPMSERRSSRRRQRHASMIAGQRRESTPQESCGSRTQDHAGSQVNRGSEVSDEEWGFILWPAGIVSCLDICHSPPLPDLPQIRLIVQDQAFRWRPRRALQLLRRGNLSSVSRNSSSYLHNPSRYSALRRITFYIHRSLRATGTVASDSTGMSSADAEGHAALTDEKEAGWDGSSGTSEERGAAKVDSQTPSTVKIAEGKSGRVGEEHEGANDGVKRIIDGESEKSAPEEQNCTQVASKKLIQFDVKAGLSRFEFLLLKEDGVARQNPTMAREELFGRSRHETALEATSGTAIVSNVNGQAAATSKYCSPFVVKFAVGNARTRIHSISHAPRCKCEATLDGICLSLGPPRLDHPGVNSAFIPSEGIKLNSNGVFEGTKKDSAYGSTQGHRKSHCFQDDILGEEAYLEEQADTGAVSPLTRRRFPGAVPFLQFNANKDFTVAECSADAVNEVATVLLAATTSCYSARSIEHGPPVSIAEIKSALNCHQLYANKRWTFPPPHLTKQNSDVCAPQACREEEPNRHHASPQRTSNFRSNHVFPGDKHELRKDSSGAHSRSQESALEGSQPFANLEEEEEVLIEDIAKGYCFLVPSSLHATVATNAAWQHLTGRVPDLALSGSLCLISLLHSLDARCNPARVTIDWEVLSGLTGFAMEVSSELTKACAAFSPPTSTADKKPQRSGHESDCPRPSPCAASGEPKKDNNSTLVYEDESLDARLFLGGADIPPWRIRIGLVMELCEVVFPTNTSSPYPDLPPSWFLFTEQGSTLTKWTPRSSQWPANRHTDFPENVAQLRRSSNRLVKGFRASVSAQDCQPGLLASFLTSDDPFIGDKLPRLTQEMLAATCPPVFVFSSSLSLSLYSESRTLNCFDDSRPCQGGAGVSEAPNTKNMQSALHQTTYRLLCSAQRIHADLLQPSRCLQDAQTLLHFLQKGSLIDGFASSKDRRLPRLARCLRPPTFGSPEAPFITLVDIQKHQSAAGSNEAEPVIPNPSPARSMGPEALIAGTGPLPNHLRRPRWKAVQGSAINASTLINGCRWRCEASFIQRELLDARTEHPSFRAKEDPLWGEGTGKSKSKKEEKEVAGVYRAGGGPRPQGSKPGTTLEALVETDPLMVNMAPAIVAAGASLLQVLLTLTMPGQPAAAGVEGCAQVNRSTSELISEVEDTKYKDTPDLNSGGCSNVALQDETVNTGSAATSPWLWTFCHSIDAVLTVRIRVECIRIESPTLELTVEDFDVLVALEYGHDATANVEPLILRPHGCDAPAVQYLVEKARRTRNKIVTSSVRSQTTLGNQRLKASSFRHTTMEGPGRRRGRAHTIFREPKVLWKTPEQQTLQVDVSENLLSFHLRFTLTAEALHRARMAIESVLEPWSCAVNIKYVPGDLLVAVAAQQPEDGNMWQSGEASLSRRKKTLAAAVVAQPAQNYFDEAPSPSASTSSTPSFDRDAQTRVNLCGESISVYVPKRVSPPKQDYERELPPIAGTAHLATDDFAFERRKALVENWREAHQADPVLRGVNESKSPLKNGNEQVCSIGNLPSTERLNALFGSSHSGNSTVPGRFTGEWRTLRHEESLDVPLDDHGQPLTLTIRVHLIGTDFEISGLKLDASNIGVRELPLKIPAVDQQPTPNPHKTSQPKFLAFTARILVRTVLTPDSRTFSTYLSSMVSVRNNSSLPITILPHPALSLLDAQDANERHTGHQTEEKERRSGRQPMSTSVPSRDEPPPHTPSDSQEDASTPHDIHPTGKHLSSTPHSSLDSDTLPSAFSLGECSGQLDASKISCSCPLEVRPHGGVGHIPLSWILPRAFVAYELQLRGLEDSRSSSQFHNADGNMAARIKSSSEKASTSSARHLTEQSASHTSLVVDSSKEGSVADNKLPANHDELLLKDMAEWRGDTTVEPLLVIPSSCLASPSPHFRLIDNSTGNRTTGSPSRSRQSGRVKGAHRPQLLKSSRLQRQLDEKKHSTQQQREDPASVGLTAEAYHDIYLQALSLGAKPLVEPSTIQQVAAGGSHSILSYDLIPQVLEFCLPPSSDVSLRRMSLLSGNPKDVEAGTENSHIGKAGHPATSSALAITVYGKSRDLVSEAEPLFFEVAVNSPISVSLAFCHREWNA
ncbi:hypothetical protein Emed_003747 [Eimeria media]